MWPPWASNLWSYLMSMYFPWWEKKRERGKGGREGGKGRGGEKRDWYSSEVVITYQNKPHNCIHVLLATLSLCNLILSRLTLRLVDKKLLGTHKSGWVVVSCCLGIAKCLQNWIWPYQQVLDTIDDLHILWYIWEVSEKILGVKNLQELFFLYTSSQFLMLRSFLIHFRLQKKHFYTIYRTFCLRTVIYTREK